jgi:hypothetical protein
VSIEQCLHILGRMGDTQEALAANANTQLTVETLLLDLPDLQLPP